MQDVGCRMSDLGCRIQDVRFTESLHPIPTTLVNLDPHVANGGFDGKLRIAIYLQWIVDEDSAIYGHRSDLQVVSHLLCQPASGTGEAHIATLLSNAVSHEGDFVAGLQQQLRGGILCADHLQHIGDNFRQVGRRPVPRRLIRGDNGRKQHAKRDGSADLQHNTFE